MKDILHHISSIYSTLPPRQRKLAEYLHQNLNQAILFNSRQLATRAGVSEATLIRFVTSLGFSGFPEFKRSVGQRILEDFTTSTRLTRSANTMKKRRSVVKDIFKGDMENLKATCTLIQEADFERAVRKICSAKTLYVLGLRSSYPLAYHLTFNLRLVLSSIALVTPGIGDLPEQLRDMGSTDLLVAISFKRYTRDTLRIVEKAKSKGVHVLAITDGELSPLAQLADDVFITQTAIPSYFESAVAPTSLLNALVTAVAVKKKRKAVSALEFLDKEFDRFETFVQ